MGDDRQEALVRSPHLSCFAHMGEVYVYHDLYGYILKMSPDVLAVLDAFSEPALPETVCTRFADAFGDQTPETFVGIFLQFACLHRPEDDPWDGLWQKVPVHGRWNVWKDEDDGGITLVTAWGDRPIARHALDPTEAAIWRAFDGETRLDALAEDHSRGEIAALVERLVHHDVQAVKISAVPLGFYDGRQHAKPPYLTSTMPYDPYDAAVDTLAPPPGDETSTEAYHRREIGDGQAQFDHQETTLSHLLRRPHPALGGRTYGQALVDGLVKRGDLAGGAKRVLEIGGGLGHVAAGISQALSDRGWDTKTDVMELSPILAEAQRARVEGLPVTIHIGDALTDPWPGEGYDLIVANEMMGDLPSVRLRHGDVGLDDPDLDEDGLRQRIEAQGEVGALVLRHRISLHDAPDPFYLNVGALGLLERVAEHLAPGGTALLTEFGDMSRWPVLSTHLDHPELSIHFGHLAVAAKSLGLDAQGVFVMDLIDLQRDLEGIATTRSHFRALQALFSDHGVSLEKIGYTRTMFEELTARAGLGSFGEVHTEPIEDRLMGLVPHEFKALILRRPAV